MDFDTAIQRSNTILFTNDDKPLSAPEIVILQGIWQGMTYPQMAAASPDYSENYLSRDVGPRLWKRLSKALGKSVSKTNFRVVLERSQHSFESPPAPRQPSIDWGDAPEVPIFFDRTSELETLTGWILQDNCRLVVVRGLSGMGKTALVRKLVDRIGDRFDRVTWCSLTFAPDLEKVMLKLSFKSDTSPETEEELMQQWRSQRHLLVFNGVDAILQTDRLAGDYREGYENYGKLFQRIGEETHQSCLILVGLETPRNVVTLAGATSPVRELELSGLSEAAARELLQAEGLVGESSWRDLIDRYQGNPAALKMVATIVRQLFHGNVTEFLERDTLIFGDINSLLDRTFDRLSEVEEEILYHLVVESESLSFAKLRDKLTLPEAKLLAVLASLERRSLLATEKLEEESRFTLSTMVQEYATQRFVKQIGRTEGLSSPLPEREESLELTPSAKSPTVLSRWLENQFEATWQSVETLIGVQSLKLSLKLRDSSVLRQDRTVKRCKRISLKGQSGTREIALLVAISQKENDRLAVRTQVQPIDRDAVLPDRLKFGLIDETGNILREIESQNQDNFIQLPRFTGELQERFRLLVSLGNIHISEEFVI